MSTEYKPGQVARITMTRTSNGHADVYDRCLWDECNEEWVSGTAGRLYPSDAFHFKVEPLVVVDLNERASDAVEAIETVLSSSLLLRPNGIHALARIARQIDEQTKPPRIDEPGLWGVVEASVGKDGRYKFVRAFEANWMCTADSSVYPWNDLVDPTLVREGIES